MTKRKRLVQTLGITLFAAIVTSMFAASASVAHAAGNWTDTLVAFRTSGDGSDIGTPSREKWDYTSSYIYNHGSTTNFNAVWVYGSYGNGALYDCTYGRPKYVPIGSAYYLPNLVKERGFTHASLRIWPEKHESSWIYTWWSPDSI